MNKKLIAIAWLAGAVLAGAKSMEDHQLWMTGSVSAGLTDRFGLSFSEQSRSQDGGEDLYYYHSQLTVPVKLGKDWVIAPGYRLIRKQSGGEWSTHNRGQLDVSRKTAWGKVGAKVRVRLEYTDVRNSDDDPWVVRPYVELCSLNGWTDRNIKPFAASEPFYDLSADNLSAVRNYVGLQADLNKKVDGSVYVLRQDKEKSHDWQSTYILGLKVRLKF